MAYAKVGSAIATSGKGGSKTLTPTLGATATANNLLIAGFHVDSQTNPTITDGIWTTASTYDYSTTNRMRIYYKVAVGGEGAGYTFDWGATNVNGSAFVMEFSGNATSSPQSGTPVQSSGTGASPEASADGGGTDEFLHMCFVGQNSSTATFSSPTESFTIDQQGGGGTKAAYMFLIQPSSPASQTPGCTSNDASNDWYTIHAMFLQAAAAGTDGAGMYHHLQMMGVY